MTSLPKTFCFCTILCPFCFLPDLLFPYHYLNNSVVTYTLNLPIIFQIPTSSFGQFHCSFSFPGTGNERRQSERAREELDGETGSTGWTSQRNYFHLTLSFRFLLFPSPPSFSPLLLLLLHPFFPALLLPPSPFRSLYRGSDSERVYYERVNQPRLNITGAGTPRKYQ